MNNIKEMRKIVRLARRNPDIATLYELLVRAYGYWEHPGCALEPRFIAAREASDYVNKGKTYIPLRARYSMCLDLFLSMLCSELEGRL